VANSVGFLFIGIPKVEMISLEISFKDVRNSSGIPKISVIPKHLR
jgi:hypothetical protein